MDRPIAPPPQPGDRVPKEKKKKVVPKKKKKTGPKRNWIGRKSKVSQYRHWITYYAICFQTVRLGFASKVCMSESTMLNGCVKQSVENKDKYRKTPTLKQQHHTRSHRIYRPYHTRTPADAHSHTIRRTHAHHQTHVHRPSDAQVRTSRRTSPDCQMHTPSWLLRLLALQTLYQNLEACLG